MERKSPPTLAPPDPGVVAMAEIHRRVQALRLPASISDLYRERAAAMGDAPAAIWFESGETLSYAALDAAADRVAKALLICGVRKGSPIAVMAIGGPHWPILWGAIARLGAVMVPVNPAYTSAELGYVLNDADVQALIIDDQLLPMLDSVDPWPRRLQESRVFVRGQKRHGLQGWNTLLEGNAGPFVAPWPVAASELFMLQYTSGTTGRPKGCMLSQSYWLQTAAVEAEVFGRPLAIRRSLVWQPMFYMAAPWRAFMIFMLGGTLFVPERMSASRFLGWLRELRIEQCTFPEWVLEHAPRTIREGELALRHVHTYGWNRQSQMEFEQRFRCPARDSFGMSEVGIATETPLQADHMSGSGSCGLANPFHEVRVCDPEGRELERDSVGELCVAGRAILTGYNGRPEANVDAFHERWFRTGDLARQDATGYVYIVGRIKDMIKRSGENISAQEVEAVLRGIPGIAEAAVVGVPDKQRTQEVKAYLRLAAGADAAKVDPAFVLEHCARSLASFKLPRYFAYVDEFPRTPTRKIAKADLVKGVADLRTGSYDAVARLWR